MAAAACADRRKEQILRAMTEYDRKAQDAEPGSKEQSLNLRFLEAWVREAERHGIVYTHDPELGYREAMQEAAA